MMKLLRWLLSVTSLWTAASAASSSEQKVFKSRTRGMWTARIQQKNAEKWKQSPVISVLQPACPPSSLSLRWSCFIQRKTLKPARVSVCELADKERRRWAENRTPGPASEERKTRCVLSAAGSRLFFISWFFSFSSLFNPHGEARSRCSGAVCIGGAHCWPSTEVDCSPHHSDPFTAGQTSWKRVKEVKTAVWINIYSRLA